MNTDGLYRTKLSCLGRSGDGNRHMLAYLHECSALRVVMGHGMEPCDTYVIKQALYEHRGQCIINHD